jgi:hypothetical protein
MSRSDDIPYTKELDLYVDGKCSLKLHTQSETLVVIPRVHGIRERQLFDVPLREKPDFLKHASEGASSEGAPRKTEDTDLIPDTI